MKKAIMYAVIVVIAYLFMLTVIVKSCHGYTYDGEFDPQEFFSWTLYEEPITVNVLMKEAIFLNPNPDAEIKVVNVLLLFLSADKVRIIAYSYEHKGVRFIFEYIEDNYVQTVPIRSDI